ncbi:hypothetical protein D3C80_462340 [compost metagenome]
MFRVRQAVENTRQRRTRLKTGYAQQHRFVIGGDGEFGKHRIFFDFSQLAVQHAAAFQIGKAFTAMEQTQVAPHFAFGVAVAAQHVLVRRQRFDVSGHLALKVFYRVGPVQRHQCPIFQRD